MEENLYYESYEKDYYSSYLENNNLTKRRDVLKVLDDLRYGRGFEHHERAFVDKSKISCLTEDSRKKLYITENYFDMVCSMLGNYTPMLNRLKYKDGTGKPRINLLNKALRLSEWDLLYGAIKDTIYHKNDVFLQMYFVEGDDVPRLKKLKTNNLVDIARDNVGNVKQYIYKEYYEDEYADKETGEMIRENKREITFIFEKGRTIKIDPSPKLDSDKEKRYVYKNRSLFADRFYIIHIKTAYKEDSAFSDMISTRWIDDCLYLDCITSDYRYINRLNAFGIDVITDGKVDEVKSSRMPSGVFYIESIKVGKQAQYKKSEITNELKTLENEKRDIEDSLYRKAFLMRPELEKNLGSTDSSRVISQLRQPTEKFVGTVINNINDAMKPYFEMVQLTKFKTATPFEFYIPNPVIQNSVFDQQVQDMQDLAMGAITMRDIWKRQGRTESEMKKMEERLNEEILNGNKDIKIEKTAKNVVDNSNNVDNNFK